MPADRDALLAAICAQPDEDTPRLAFADWCDENGDPARAEFIRLQFKAERYAEHTPERLDIDEHASALLEQNRGEWIDGVPDWALDPQWPPTIGDFCHGFLDRIAATAENVLTHSNDLFAAAPVRKAEIRLIRDGGLTLASSPALARLSKVELAFAETPIDLPAFLNSPYLSQLTELSLRLVGPPHTGASFWTSQPMLDDAGAIALAGCAGLSGLKSLDVAVGHIGPRGVAALARSPHLDGVEKLDIRANPIGDDGLVELANSGSVPRLTDLNLYGTDTADRGLHALLTAGPTRLRSVHIGYYQNCPITDAGMRAFADCESLANLRELDLSSWPLTRGRVRAVAQSPHFARVQNLNLSSCAIGDEIAEELARSPHLRNLRFIDLQNNHIGTVGFTALARSPVMATVTYLGLYNNRGIGDAGVAALAASEHAAELRSLSLVRVGLGIDGLRAVAASRWLGQLRYLGLESSPLGNEGARILCESPYLNRLTRLTLYNCGIGEGMTAALRKRFGTALKI
jgi:uncharacterized protein (TIGR02996 family)